MLHQWEEKHMVGKFREGKKMHSTTLWVITLCITLRAHNQLHPSTLGASKPRDAVEDDDDITHANTEFEQSHS